MPIKRTQSITRQGVGQFNEDMLVESGLTKVFAVIDGVTSLPGERMVDGATPGLAAAKCLAGAFLHCTLSESLTETVTLANQVLRETMMQQGVDVAQKDKLWSAAFVAVRVNSLNVEFVQAGDCMLFAQYDDGCVRAITRDQVFKYDQRSILERMENAAKGLEREELWNHISQKIAAQRWQTNTPSGYGIFNGDPALSSFLESGIFNRAGLTKLYLLSDGLFYPSEVVGQADWGKTIRLIDDLGLDGYTKHLIELEKDDADCVKFPRHKVSDDKTGIVIELE